MKNKSNIKNLPYYLDDIGWIFGLKLSSIGFHKIASLFYNLCNFRLSFLHNPFEVVSAICNYTTDKKLMEYNVIFNNRHEFDRFMFFYFKQLTQQEEVKVEILFDNEETRQVENYYEIRCKDGRRDFSNTSSMVIICDDHNFLLDKLNESLKNKDIWSQG